MTEPLADFAIKVENLSKCYQIYDKPHQRLMQMLWHGRRKYYHEFWALKDVSFTVKPGETVGIIGKNGSGKSTLLKMICGTLNPTSGEVRASGRIAALLELGSGFNADFTGRENVYMNAAILGLSQKEIEDRFANIVAFADIGEFMEQPVKTYSSGMYVRLAFAVQAMVDPDILIIDEALSVGDVKFQAKCFERLRQLKEKGTSILLVTHSTDHIVTHCNRAVLLNEGRMLEIGDPKYISNRYLDLLFGCDRSVAAPQSATTPQEEPNALPEISSHKFTLEDCHDAFSTHPGYNEHEYRWGDGAAVILDFYFEADGVPFPAAVSSGQNIVIAVSARFLSDMVRPIFGFEIKTKEGVKVYGANSESLSITEFREYGQAGSIIHVTARFPCHLAHGDYFLSLGISTRDGDDIIPHDRRYDAIHVHVEPTLEFYGIANLNVALSSSRVGE
ncbi:MAG: ABC transporter ATP-binding protein [Desulfobulbaceae bacterium]|jgi:lipopolysaccharide transport system ATP-binding protein|nr:ABC transporter ATP-binding protein [Desulfobulbaceae bacterium]